jgi:hypothetical protein
VKTGYRVCIQKSLTAEQKEVGLKYIDEFIKKVAAKDGSYARAFNTCAGWRSWFKRGSYGMSVAKDSGLVFRRISKGRRIFGIQAIDSLIYDKTHDHWSCACPQHKGSLRVVSKLTLDDFHTVYEEGEIKG